MTAEESGGRIFNSVDLVPAAWKLTHREGTRFRVFNPAIARSGDGYAMCYRVVADGSDERWLATCLLTPDYDVVEDSVTPFSDLVSFADQGLNARARAWHADPRYFSLRGRLYLYWNDGANRPVNNQFLCELDGKGLAPAAPTRALETASRRAIEKNWMLFDHACGVFASYSVAPHLVLKFELDTTLNVLCGEQHSISGWDADYESIYGVLRGSSQPTRIDDSYLALVHSSFKSSQGRTYSACFVRFSPEIPFAILECSVFPFELPNPFGRTLKMKPLNKDVSEVVYPCGMVRAGDKLIISYGVNDEHCAIAEVLLADVLSSLAPVGSHYSVGNADREMRVGQAPQDSGYLFPIAIPPTPLMWWDTANKKFDSVIGTRRFQIGNFGDIASRDIVEAVTGHATTPMAPSARPKLLCIGSIIHTALNGDVVWGSGMKGGKTALDPKVTDLSVHAVRGPLTLDMVRRHGIDVSRVTQLFDPGCLFPHIWKDKVADVRALAVSAPFRIIPHYRDDMLLRRQRENFKYLRYFLSVDCTTLQMIESLAGAERVISSSLHGIIFAESLGVPAQWLKSIGGEDDLKFYDYYYGTSRYAVKAFDTVQDALLAEPMPLPKFDFEAYVATFPKDNIAELGSDGLAIGTVISFAGEGNGVPADMFSFWNFDRRGREGIWSTSRSSRLSTVVKSPQVGEMSASMTLRPFNHIDFRQPQSVNLSVNGSPQIAVKWERGCMDSVRVTVPFRVTKGRNALEIAFAAQNSRSPASLGIPSIEEPITFCLIDIAVTAAPSRG